MKNQRALLLITLYVTISLAGPFVSHWDNQLHGHTTGIHEEGKEYITNGLCPLLYLFYTFSKQLFAEEVSLFGDQPVFIFDNIIEVQTYCLSISTYSGRAPPVS